MNAQNAAQFLPLVQALADGKMIQEHNVLKWVDLKNPQFTREPDCYRVKPEPREFSVILCNDGCIRDARICFDCAQSQSFRVREILD
jgi:hypothetical protein